MKNPDLVLHDIDRLEKLVAQARDEFKTEDAERAANRSLVQSVYGLTAGACVGTIAMCQAAGSTPATLHTYVQIAFVCVVGAPIARTLYLLKESFKAATYRRPPTIEQYRVTLNQIQAREHAKRMITADEQASLDVAAYRGFLTAYLKELGNALQTAEAANGRRHECARRAADSLFVAGYFLAAQAFTFAVHWLWRLDHG